MFKFSGLFIGTGGEMRIHEASYDDPLLGTLALSVLIKSCFGATHQLFESTVMDSDGNNLHKSFFISFMQNSDMQNELATKLARHIGSPKVNVEGDCMFIFINDKDKMELPPKFLDYIRDNHPHMVAD